MPRQGYRSGEKRVDVWLTVAGHGNLKRLAAEWDCSLSDAVARLVREKVSGDGGGVASGVRRSAPSSERGGGDGAAGVGEDSLGVQSGDVAVPLDESLWELLERETPARRLASAPEPAEPVVDKFASDYIPANRDSRGRLMKPVVRDEWIDTA
jgi:hypothetical protein